MNEEQLKALLHQWCDIEPAGNFEVNVRRRIRLAAGHPRQSSLIGLLYRPAFAVAAAVVLSAVIGSSAGLVSRPRNDGAELQFLKRVCPAHPPPIHHPWERCRRTRCGCRR